MKGWDPKSWDQLLCSSLDCSMPLRQIGFSHNRDWVLLCLYAVDKNTKKTLWSFTVGRNHFSYPENETKNGERFKLEKIEVTKFLFCATWESSACRGFSERRPCHALSQMCHTRGVGLDASVLFAYGPLLGGGARLREDAGRHIEEDETFELVI